MNLYQILVEALDEFQHDYLRDTLGGDKYDPEKSHPEMFNNYPDKVHPHRIVIPLNSSNLNDKANSEVKIHLLKHGWNIHDYKLGLASRNNIDRNGNDKPEIKKIGKILQQTGADKVPYSQPRDRLIKGNDGKPLIGEDGRMKSEKVPQSLLDFYNADKTRDSVKAEHNIVISRDLDDIGGMSTNRNWRSCMRLPDDDEGGQYHHRIENDLEHHTLVAYVAKRGDDDLENPVGRILIKKYEVNRHKSKGEHTIYRPENKEYGDMPDEALGQIEHIMKTHYPTLPDTHYRLHDDLYDDGRNEVNPIKIGLHTDDDGSITHYNSQGQLHDYVDEHGVKQAAVHNTTERTHYKNGLKHSDDDEPTSVSKIGDVRLYRHYKNGELHREGDKPAVYQEGGNYDQHDEYHYGGLEHREGDKPSVIIDENGTHIEKYHHAGLLHRIGGAAYTRTGEYGDMIEHRIHGKLISPDNNTPSQKIVNYHDYEGVRNGEMFHNKLGQEHRDGDLPSKDYTIKNRNDVTTHVVEYKKNGELHRENDLPAMIKTIHDRGNINIEKAWYNKGETLSSENTPYKTITSNGRVIQELYNHENPDKPTEKSFEDDKYVIYYGNKMKGRRAQNLHSDGTPYYDTYRSGRNYASTESNIMQLTNRTGEPSRTIFKDDNDNIHVIHHDMGTGYSISPNKELTSYDTTLRLPIGVKKDTYQHYNKEAKRVIYTKSNMYNAVDHRIKEQAIDMELPLHHINLLDELHRRLN